MVTINDIIKEGRVSKMPNEILTFKDFLRKQSEVKNGRKQNIWNGVFSKKRKIIYKFCNEWINRFFNR